MTASQDSIVITGVGSYLPEKILTNADLEKMVETTDEWIMTRTGIKTRHIAAPGQAASHMAAEAAKRALADAGAAPEEVDLIIVATVTPDMMFPSTACLVQEMIGAKNAFCFDIEAACSGFLYGMEVVSQFLQNGKVKTALLIGSEKLSAFTDWSDRTTCVLFGDGAGAVVMKKVQGSGGLLASYMGSDGKLADLLNIPGGGSRFPASKETIDQKLHCLKMSGREVFKHAVRRMSDAANRVLAQAGVTIDQVKLIIPHQANMRIISAIGDLLHVEEDKIFVNLPRVGNISGASIPVALDEAVKTGRICKGDLVLFVAFGGGFTWGASLMRWEK